MTKKFLSLVLGVTLFMLCVQVDAQPRKRAPRIGFLSGGSADTNAARDRAFRDGLKALGYVEGKNVVVEWRFAENNPDRYPELVADLVRFEVDVIVTAGSASTRMAKKGANSIPIVMAQDPDPVGNGYVASLSRPGGNITGLSNYSASLNSKRLELLKEIIPKLSRLAVLGDSSFPGNVQALSEMELAARALNVRIESLDVQDHKDIESLFRAASKGRSDAVFVVGGHFLTSHRAQIADLAIKSRLAVMSPNADFVKAGVLMAYGVSRLDLFRRAATYVDKILKGAKPADLPVEQPTKFELVINLNAAKQIGLTLPESLLYRADRVIR